MSPAKKKRTPHAYQPSNDSKNVGEDHGRAILTEDAVIAARTLVRKGIPVSDLAVTFGVSISVMSRAIKGATWGHLPGAVDDVERLGEYTITPSRRKKKKPDEPDQMRPAANDEG